MGFNKEQLKAINSVGNVIVSAGAGSGKTSVLTTRISNHLLSDTKLDEILILTFTDNAASEMKMRIKKALSENENTKNLVPLVDSANISTFDAYFSFLVKKYSSRLNISRDIENMPEDLVTIKRYEYIKEIFDNYYENQTDTFKKLVHNYLKKDDAQFYNVLFNLSKLSSEIPNFNEYINNYVNNYLSENKINEYFNSIYEYSKNLIEELHRLLNRYAIKTYEKIHKKTCIFEVEKDFKGYLDCFNSLKGVTISNLVKEDKENLDEIQASLVQSKIDEFKKIKGFYNEIGDYESILNVDIENNKELIPFILNIVREANIKIDKFKRLKGFYTFNDIASLAFKLLKENEDIRLELKNKYKLIMIDEYQDTSTFQEEFINLISNNNVFVVGDVKQSIYGFRNANPKQFVKKYNSYKHNEFGEAIDMNTNYRSRKEINDKINEIFSIIMTNEFGEANYKDEHIIHSGNGDYETRYKTKEPKGIFTLNIYDENKKVDEKGKEIKTNSLTWRNLTINKIIDDILKHISNKVQVVDKDTKSLRDCTFKDFTILIYSSTTFKDFEKICANRGVPINAIYDEDIRQDDAIIVILNLLRLVNGILKNTPFNKLKHYYTSVLRSFLFSKTDEEIYKEINEDGYLHSDIFNKINAFSLTHKDSLLSETYFDLIKEFNFFERLTLIGNAISKFDYIKMFYDRTLIMDKLSYSLDDFIVYLEFIDKLKLKMPSRKSSNVENAITLTTIHKSKGLEYSIVYLPFLFSKSDRKNEGNGNFYLDKNLGIYLPSLFNKKNHSLHTIFNDVLINKKESNEKMRILYVALTRAKEEVIIPLNEENLKEIEELKEEDTFKVLAKTTLMGEILFSSKVDLKEVYTTSLVIKEVENIDIKHSDSLKIEEFKWSFEDFLKNRPSKKVSENANLKALKYGTHIHLLMEEIDLKTKDTSFITNKIEKSLIDKVFSNKLFSKLENTNIYKEYEYLDEFNSGVIDLMIEYKDHIDIIDYKLKNINDKEYNNQLNDYRKYIKKLFKKEVKCYLLSIINNEVREIYE